MTRERTINLLLLAILIGIGVWIARNTYWEDITVPIPPRGAAADNPYYSLERLAALLGVRTREVASLPPLPPPDAVLLAGLARPPPLSNENLPAIERWVEAGGRLAVPSEVMRQNKALQAWSGISPIPIRPAPKPADGTATKHGARATPMTIGTLRECTDLEVASDGTPTGATLTICGVWVGPGTGFTSLKPPTWSLGNATGLYALRIAMGKGSVAVTAPMILYETRTVLKDDHAKIVFTAAGIKRGDELWLYRPKHAEPLLAMLWRLAAPAIVCAGIALALWIWRNLPRFGPPAPAPVAARRSLAEQIRANASFYWRTRRLAALYAAARRALEEAARREIVAYERMPSAARIGAIATHSGLSSVALQSALVGSADGGADAQRGAIAVLEQARRLLVPKPSLHAKV
jgi:hypothetical protein